jgi:hypothetical protein
VDERNARSRNVVFTRLFFRFDGNELAVFELLRDQKAGYGDDDGGQ